MLCRRHRKVETVLREAQIQVRCRETGPATAARTRVALAVTEWLQEEIKVRLLAAQEALHIFRAGVILRVVGRGEQGQKARVL